jgi:hypothetical protein
MDYSSRDTTVEDLLVLVDNGQIGLPEFQRDFIWSPAKVVDLLRSVAKRWPAGSFLIMEDPQGFACRPLKHAPPLLKEPDLIILDGQQRLTAMYHAFRGKSEEVYYVDIKEMLEAEDEDEYIKYMRRNRFENQYPTLQSLAKAMLLPVTITYEDDKFFEWLRFLNPDLQYKVVREREDKLSGLKKRIYRMPAVHLAKDIDLAALAKIFETINRTGVRLDTFDLMTAALTPHNFNLRERWKEALDEYGDLLGVYDVNGIEILKLIALIEYLEKVEQGGRSIVRGIRQSDVLTLKPQVVIAHWHKAIELYCRALSFVRQECGVVSPKLVPSDAMLLTLAASLGLQKAPSTSSAIKRRAWFWASSFQQLYSQGTNTQVISDAKALRAWIAGTGPILESIMNKWADVDAFYDKRRRNEILTRAIQCLLISRGARDWLNAEAIKDSGANVDLHHLFAERDLNTQRSIEHDLIPNFVVSSSSTMGQLRKSNFIGGIMSGRITMPTEVLASHCITPEALEHGSWLNVLKVRATCFASLVASEQKIILSDLDEPLTHE